MQERTIYKAAGYMGGGCVANTFEVDIDGEKIVRIRPLQYDKKYNWEDLRPWKITARGKTLEAQHRYMTPPLSLVYKNRVYSKNRILHPLKRVDWDPKGERNPQTRGEAKFERISWDEALEIIHDELQRVLDEYGPYSILAQVDGHGECKCIHGPHGTFTELLNIFGGYTFQARQPDSWEGWCWGAKHSWGQQPLGQGNQNNLWLDTAENTDTLLVWGCDVLTTPWGWGGMMADHVCRYFHEIGIRQIYISPDVNYGCAVHNDKWIPIYPNTDAALQCAIAYVWLTEDLYDKEYVATHATKPEEFFKYILGEEDGEPKTPKWAEKHCGVPSRIIKAIARSWAKKPTSIGHGNGGSYIRSCYSHEPARLETLLLCMQGVGKPGRNALKFMEWGMFGEPMATPHPMPEFMPFQMGAYHGWMMGLQPSFIPKTLITKALLGDYTEENPLYWYSFPDPCFPPENQFLWYQYPVAGAKPIHMIWSDTPCWSTCWNNGMEMAKALRTDNIEFVLVQHPWFENDCKFADILLPVNTSFEEQDFGIDNWSGSFTIAASMEPAIAPIGESKTDFEISCMIAETFGDDVYIKYTEGKKEGKSAVFSGGNAEGLVDEGFDEAEPKRKKTFDEIVEDSMYKGWAMSGMPDYVSYEEFRETGYWVGPTKKDWEKDPRGFEEFCKDPEGHPLSTPTGKVCFYSDALANGFPDDQERPPVPHFVEESESHHERLTCDRAKDYPFLLVSNHPHWRVHAQLDDSKWIREIPTCKIKGPDGYLYEPVWINPVDAEELGIEDGQVVRLFNERGWVMGAAMVTPRIARHTLLQDHGARVDYIIPGFADRGGANNLICPANTSSKNAVGEVTSGFLVGIEAVDVFELAKQYPEPFSRSFGPEGVDIDNWLV